MCAVAVSASIREKVTRVKLSDNLSEDMCPTPKQYILELNPAADDQTLYICASGVSRGGARVLEHPP